MLKTAVVATIVCLVKFVQAAEPPISGAELANITGYPAEKIIIDDGTVESNRQATRKKRPQCLSHHYYHSSIEDTFASVSIAIGKMGTALSPELEAKFSKTLETPNYPGNLRALTMGAGIKGYSGIGMAGGGGSMYRSVISLSNYDRDIQVTVSLGEEGLTPLAGAEAYRDAVLTYDGVNAIIEKCLTAASNNVIASLGSEGATESPASPQEQQSKPTAPLQQTAPEDAAAIEPKDQSPKESSSTWLWWLLGLAVAVLAFIANALRKPRR